MIHINKIIEKIVNSLNIIEHANYTVLKCINKMLGVNLSKLQIKLKNECIYMYIYYKGFFCCFTKGQVCFQFTTLIAE